MLFILMLLIGGMYYWHSHQRGKRWEWPGALPGFGRGGPAADRDVRHRSAWVQSQVRDLLAKNGVNERHVLKTYTRERTESGVRWLEGTLELERPAGFDSKRFFSGLSAALAGKGYSVLRDIKKEETWVLELGEEERIYQRLLLFEVQRQSRAKAAKINSWTKRERLTAAQHG